MEPVRVFFPTEDDLKEVTLSKGPVYTSLFDVTITQPGYYALSPFWDALFMGLSNMRLECRYSLEPPTDPSAGAPSWSTSAGAVLRPSMSGLMRLVSENTRFIGDATGHFSSQSARYEQDCGPKLMQGSFSTSRWHVSKGGILPGSPSQGMVENVPASTVERNQPRSGICEAPACTAAGSSGDRLTKPNEEQWKLTKSATERPCDEGKGSVAEITSGDDLICEATRASELPPTKSNPTDSSCLPQTVQGVSLTALFEEGRLNDGDSPVQSFAATVVRVTPKKETETFVLEEPGMKNSSQGSTGEPRTEKEDVDSSSSSTPPKLQQPLEPKRPITLSTAEDGPSEKSTVVNGASAGDQPKDSEIPLSQETPPRDCHLQEDPLHSTAPSEAHAQLSTVANCTGSANSGGPELPEGSAEAERGLDKFDTSKDMCPKKFPLREDSFMSLHSWMLQLARGGTPSEWGNFDIFRSLSSLPEGPAIEEDQEELKEDVLFYEADGHYTDTGEEYSLPLGEQQQLVKLLPCNIVSVRAKRRKFSFIFVPSAGCHLLIDLRASMSLGMSLSSTLELVYCGSPSAIYKEISPLCASAGRKCILSLDGAGLYAAVGQLVMLRQLEKEVRFLLGDRRINLTSCFDFVVGTGTGALLALALLRGITITRLLKEWTGVAGKNLDELAPEWREAFFLQLVSGVEPKILRSELVDKFGWRFLNTLNAPLGTITCSDIAQSPPQQFVLRTYEHTSPASHVRSLRGTSRCPLWVAAWATIASPGSLRPIRPADLEGMGFFVEPKVCLTGSTSTNALAANPTLAGLEECARLAHKPLRSFIHSDLQLLVSLGARKFLTTSSVRQGPLEPFATEGLTTATLFAHREALHWLADRLDVYFRFNMPVVGDISLSPTNPHGLTKILSVASEYITDEKFFEMKKAAKILAHNIKARIVQGKATI
ncbi:patatin-like phospholipase domain-containing protein, putative [Eimeria necatrix]|uniref:Patatin-like phospholipase domain-containing protein, putative n=1 Tax=Eimeria necatrix TaxID=51315 RepID=U6MZC6_9EIME|nr:patatin-like phospholipase domain-containing protein, putative [Eimeria necatrix]CDJ69553.1 patatin-like phospholipase domain-containing protein, putative [Eimeria necatrix]